MLIDKSLWDACAQTLQTRSFARAYEKIFKLVQANTPELKRRAHHLLYKVYCEEHDCSALACSVGCFVTEDIYDERSVHFLLMHNVSHEIAGVLRLVLPNDEQPGESFPMQEHSDHPFLKFDSRALSLCEVADFVMAPCFRQREGDGEFLSSYQQQDSHGGHKQGNLSFIRRKIPYAPAVLLTGAFEAAMQARILDLVWMVEPAHLESLSALGFTYRKLGPPVKRIIPRQPIVFNIKHVLDNMKLHAPQCWEVISDGGRLQEMADTLNQNDWYDSLIDSDCLNALETHLSDQ